MQELRIFLRYWSHAGAKWASTVSIRAPWITFERVRIPSPGLLASKDKEKKNALPANIRRARLQEPSSDTLAKTSDEDRSDASPEVDDLLNTVTGKLLRAKRKAEAKEPPHTHMRRIIFNANYYAKTRCSNRRGCCYVLKSKGIHYAVLIAKQDE